MNTSRVSKIETATVDRDSIIRDFHRIENPTWQDLHDAVRKANFEYGCGYLSSIDSFETFPSIPKATDPIKGRVIAYWVIGGSEGHWVHVHEMIHVDDKYRGHYEMQSMVFDLKFLTENEKQDAMEATNFILRLAEEINEW